MSEPVPLHAVSKPAELETLGPFQRAARNYGISLERVAKLPKEWPWCTKDHQVIADALYDAGFPPGDGLITMARKLWRERPSMMQSR